MEQNTKELARLTAARWYARLQASDCAQSERAEFETWLHQSEDNLEAFRKAERLASVVAVAVQSDPRFAQLAELALEQPRGFNTSRWRVAAALTIGIGLALAGLVNRNQSGDAQLAVEHHNATKQQQRFVLQDGSVVYLDVDSRVSVRMAKSQRMVEVVEGRAYFEVVHDASRPFLVNAGALRTTDLGTRFQVSVTDKNDVSVTLVEGAVQVSDRKDSGVWRQTLSPGEQVLLKSGSSALEKMEVDASAITSWSTGRLVFKGTPLATVLDEVNRYSDCKIHLGDATLASIPIGGNFIAGGDSEQVIDALAAVLPLRVVRVGTNEIVLFHRNDT